MDRFRYPYCLLLHNIMETIVINAERALTAAESIRIDSAELLEFRRKREADGHKDLRIAYIMGPGDVYGTYKYWKEGFLDPRLPVIAYSYMFYDLCDRLDARALLLQRAGGLEERTEDGAFTFVPVEFGRFGGRLSYFARYFGYTVRCAIEILKFRPQYLLVGGSFATPFFPLMCLFGIKNILSIHNTYWPRGTKQFSRSQRFYNAVKRISLRRSIYSTVCTSLECANQFRELTNRIIPSFVEFPQYPEEFVFESPAPPGVRGIESSEKKLVFLGRIEESKGIFDLLEAAEILRDEGVTGIKWLLAGHGNKSEQLAAEIDTRFSNNEVEYLGLLDGNQIHELLCDTYCVICPTQFWNEGLALVCVEAMIHELPTVMSSTVPAADLLGDAAIIFPATSAADLAQQVKRLLNDQEYYKRACEAASINRNGVLDRSQSWGSQLFRALSRGK